jgi:glycosyltransferase involved in cell wall biosynthesis
MTLINVFTPNGAMPKISIITPSYNQGDFLEETILSVLNQTYQNIEYIIIDGGSNDSSLDIIAKYKHRLTYWISEPDHGQGDAINKGYLHSQGEFITWLNSDDLLYKDAIENMVKAILENPGVDLFYGNIMSGHTQKSASVWYGRQTSFEEMIMSYHVPIPQQGSIFSRRVLEKTGFLDSRWHYVLDRELFLRISKCSKIKYVPETLGFFRLHKSSKSVNRDFATGWCQEISSLYEHITSTWDPSFDSPRFSKNRILALVYLHCASKSLKNGSLNLFLIFIVKALVRYSALFFSTKSSIYN